MSWQIQFTSRADRDLSRLTESDRRVIFAAVRALGAGAIAYVKKLKGRTEYRVRIGRWRALYELRDNQLIVLRILDRKDAYR